MKVEDNWIKINSKDDLPKSATSLKDYKEYFVRNRDGKITVAANLNMWFWMENYTHYQEVVFPDPPKV